MNFFIDCEFNEHGGELISLALVSQTGESLYITYKMKGEPGPWVKEHVMPILYSVPNPFPGYIYKESSKVNGAMSIAAFINSFSGIPHIIADWPADIQYFCESLMTGPGETVNIRKFTTEVDRYLKYNSTEVAGAISHNAWWDAKCIREVYLRNK